MVRQTLLAIVFLTCAAPNVWSQTPAVPAEERETASDGERRTRLQVGVGFKSTLTPSGRASSRFKPDLFWRWRGRDERTDDRFVPAFRLSSMTSAISRTVGVASVPIGDVRLHPLLAGIDYRMPRGKWNWSAGVAAGWAINRVNVAPATSVRSSAARPDDLWADIHNSFAWGPRVQGSYDVNPRISVLLDASYLSARPRLDMRANGVVSSSRINADALIVKVGVVYGIY